MWFWWYLRGETQSTRVSVSNLFRRIPASESAAVQFSRKCGFSLTLITNWSFFQTHSALFQVCGSDGISYSNECKLRAEACERKKNIVVRYQGLCSKYWYCKHCLSSISARSLCDFSCVYYPHQCLRRLLSWCSTQVKFFSPCLFLFFNHQLILFVFEQNFFQPRWRLIKPMVFGLSLPHILFSVSPNVTQESESVLSS